MDDFEDVATSRAIFAPPLVLGNAYNPSFYTAAAERYECFITRSFIEEKHMWAEVFTLYKLTQFLIDKNLISTVNTPFPFV